MGSRRNRSRRSAAVKTAREGIIIVVVKKREAAK
jgi:hypothetical protein